MWKEPLDPALLSGGAELSACIDRIEKLAAIGCRLLRFAVPDLESAERVGALAARTPMPLVADIHFDYKIALRVLDFPLAKIRINPGNIGSPEKTARVLDKCAEKKVPIRIGLNAGSLPRDLQESRRRDELSAAEALFRAAERELAIFDRHGFYDVVVSMKASSVRETIEVNELFAARYDLPLHIGVTEAGPLIAGVARSSAALFSLLSRGIGATLRVSLSDTMENEIIAAKEILLAADRIAGVRIISCPRCGRYGFDTHAFVQRWQDACMKIQKNLTVAIMGCAVNGPGEAREADLGITGTGNKIIIFKRGKLVKTVDKAEADEAFATELAALTKRPN
jgi:(E)-4-hydroxy-3-methylbut-2-enyl-diphosphate synthase